MNNFQKNLKFLADRYSQKYIANATDFSQASINNYLSKSSEPSMQFLIALKNAFGVSLDDFLFGDISDMANKNYRKYVGNYIVYYYNNSSYKGEVHTNISNTLSYGVVSVSDINNDGKGTVAYGTFLKEKQDAIKLLKRLNTTKTYEEVKECHMSCNNFFTGTFDYNDQSIFLELGNKNSQDHAFLIFNNPQSNANYIGGIGTVNTVARGREHNPCVEFIIMSKRLLDKPDSQIYNHLKFDDYKINLNHATSDLVDLFKRLYDEKNELSNNLAENQKMAIIQNKLEYHFGEILEDNIFRFAKVTNKEDDMIYKLIKEGIDV